MATNKEIQAFAIKYYNLYMNPQATFGEATETFADECLTLGFEVMKYGEGLEREYPDENVWDAEGFDEISDDITDVHLLGSAIFSKWTAMESLHFRWTYSVSAIFPRQKKRSEPALRLDRLF